MKRYLAIKCLLIINLLTLFIPADAQNYKLNFGLQRPQEAASLPVPLSARAETKRVPYRVPVPVLEKVSPVEYILKDGWELTDGKSFTESNESLQVPYKGGSKWFNAVVPGTVLTSLVSTGVFPDPYYGLNNLFIPDTLCRTDWWYRSSVPLPEGETGKNLWLVFNGINYRADIWFNGIMIGRMTGAFKRGIFDITPFLKEKNNTVAVHVYPPFNPGIPHEESARTDHGPNGGQLCLDGPTFISSEGWDWIPGIRDRNIGIWQDVRLVFTGPVVLFDPQVITDLNLPDTTIASIYVSVSAVNTSGKKTTATVTADLLGLNLSRTIELDPGEKEIVKFDPSQYRNLEVQNPELWWPNGLGKQNLFKAELKAVVRGALSDQVSARFGIREFTYELMVAGADGITSRIEFNPVNAGSKILFDNIKRKDVGGGIQVPYLTDTDPGNAISIIAKESNNPYLTIKVNGVPVFCRGGNWGMDDGMKRTERSRLEPYLMLHKEAGYNMIRNWTGESTEEIFYDLCDEYGMLVWNDFWLSTEGYNLNVNDELLFMDNASDVVKRFRNHPSIAVWCPRNEGYATSTLEKDLANLIATEDGTRYYSANSRYINLRPSGPWHYLRDPGAYFKSIADGFSTELGTTSIPTAETMKSFLPEAERWPVSDAWHYHDFHTGQKDFVAEMTERFGKPVSLEDFCRKAQILNYESHRAMFESWNGKMWNNASGILLWMTHPAWPSMVWQTYSWDYETFGSWFGAKKACEPLHIQLNLNTDKVIAVNTTLKSYPELKASLSIIDLTGKIISRKESAISLKANSLTECFSPEMPASVGVYLLRLELSDGRRVISVNDYWRNSDGKDYMALESLDAPALTSSAAAVKGNVISFTVTNRGKVPAVAIKFNIRRSSNGRIVLPVYFSEGYINLLPGEKRRVTVEIPSGIDGTELWAEGHNLPTVQLKKF